MWSDCVRIVEAVVSVHHLCGQHLAPRASAFHAEKVCVRFARFVRICVDSSQINPAVGGEGILVLQLRHSSRTLRCNTSPAVVPGSRGSLSRMPFADRALIWGIPSRNANRRICDGLKESLTELVIRPGSGLGQVGRPVDTQSAAMFESRRLFNLVPTKRPGDPPNLSCQNKQGG
jgi:hypothetical protein